MRRWRSRARSGTRVCTRRPWSGTRGRASALEFLRVRNPDDAAKLSELQTRFFRNAAACALKFDKWCGGAEALPEGAAIDPDDIRARYKLGVAYARRGDAVRADACFAAIVEKGGEGCG